MEVKRWVRHSSSRALWLLDKEKPQLKGEGRKRTWWNLNDPCGDHKSSKERRELSWLAKEQEVGLRDRWSTLKILGYGHEMIWRLVISDCQHTKRYQGPRKRPSVCWKWSWWNENSKGSGIILNIYFISSCIITKISLEFHRFFSTFFFTLQYLNSILHYRKIKFRHA